MSYRNSAKNRKFKRSLLKLISFLKFDSFNITIPYKITFVGALISIFSLFLNWIFSSDNIVSGNSFYKVLGITGFLILISSLKTLFFILNQKQKEGIKKILNINVKDGFLALVFGIFSLFLSINSIFIIENLNILKSGIYFGNGIIVSIVGSTFIIIGGFLMLFEKTKTGIYVDEKPQLTQENAKDINNELKNNMKLPF